MTRAQRRKADQAENEAISKPLKRGRNNKKKKSDGEETKKLKSKAKKNKIKTPKRQLNVNKKSKSKAAKSNTDFDNESTTKRRLSDSFVFCLYSLHSMIYRNIDSKKHGTPPKKV